jgi:hypothetical protein
MTGRVAGAGFVFCEIWAHGGAAAALLELKIAII